MSKSEEKLNWIKEYMQTQEKYVDILNRTFSDAYIERFNPRHRVQPFGANTCPELGRILSMGFKKGMFERGRAGITTGFPGMAKWVYVYNLK